MPAPISTTYQDSVTTLYLRNVFTSIGQHSISFVQIFHISHSFISQLQQQILRILRTVWPITWKTATRTRAHEGKDLVHQQRKLVLKTPHITVIDFPPAWCWAVALACACSCCWNNKNSFAWRKNDTSATKFAFPWKPWKLSLSRRHLLKEYACAYLIWVMMSHDDMFMVQFQLRLNGWRQTAIKKIKRSRGSRTCGCREKDSSSRSPPRPRSANTSAPHPTRTVDQQSSFRNSPGLPNTVPIAQDADPAILEEFARPSQFLVDLIWVVVENPELNHGAILRCVDGH